MATPPAKMRALVLAGDGINCERETAEAFRLVGFEVDVRHLNDLILEGLNQDELRIRYAALALPGGFSFGDDIASGKILALKIRHGLKWDLLQYAQRGGVVLGVCNGFQALIRLGIFGKMLSITHNQSGKFINTWVRVVPSGKKCVWLKGVGRLDLPIRHGEGRIVFEPQGREESLGKLERLGHLCLRYEHTVNGSDDSLAGLCDSTGRILGLMPHPEAFLRWTSNPDWHSQASRAGAPGDGLVIFESAFKEAKGST